MNKLIFLIVALISCIDASGQTFYESYTFGNTYTTEFKYTVTDEDNKTCEVTGYRYYNHECLAIPSSATYNGKSYKITSIGSNAFANCEFDRVVFYANITHIGNGAFKGCKNLGNIDIPYSVTDIGTSAFEDCILLESIRIPSKVTNIESFAFANLPKITSIYIPHAVTKLSPVAFKNCQSLVDIEIGYNNQNYCALDGAVYNIEKTKIIFYLSGITNEQFVIPEYVNTIGWGAFYEHPYLKSIKIPNSVSSVEDYAFYGCPELSSITIPYSVKLVGTVAFAECTNLSSIFLPNSITSFGHNSELNVYLENTAFYHCPNIQHVYYDTENPIKADDTLFSDYNTPTLHVRESAIPKFLNTAPWKNFANIQAYDFAGIEDINIDNDNSSPEVFNINGVKVSDNTNNLPCGIYILRQDKEYKKIIVK